MSEATINSGRRWIPDLVADCWRALNEDGLWRTAFVGNPPGDGRLLGERGAQWRGMAQKGLGWAPSQLVDEFKATVAISDSGRRATELLRMLVALDRAGDGIGFRQPSSDPTIEPILERWRNHGKLGRSSSRTVVLRKAAAGFPGGASLDQYLRNYTVFESRTHAVHVHPLLDYQSFLGLNRTELKIAFVPVLGRESDAFFAAGRADNSFVVVLDPNRQRDLELRIQEVTFALDDEGVNIAVLPEACVTERIAQGFSEALAKNLARHRNSLPALRLVVLGIGAAQRPDAGTQIYNDVRILGIDGRQVCRQTKMQPWRLDDRQRERYGLGPDQQFVWEDINLESPPTLHAIEDETFGRLVVLICEDLTRVDPSRQLVAQLGPSLVIAPVMDDSLERRSWSFSAAQQIATGEPYAIVLVSNSCWLSHLSGPRSRRFRRPAPSGAAREPGIGIVHHHRKSRLVLRDRVRPEFHVATIDLRDTLASRKSL
jgi:hypothetical protein